MSPQQEGARRLSDEQINFLNREREAVRQRQSEVGTSEVFDRQEMLTWLADQERLLADYQNDPKKPGAMVLLQELRDVQQALQGLSSERVKIADSVVDARLAGKRTGRSDNEMTELLHRYDELEEEVIQFLGN